MHEADKVVREEIERQIRAGLLTPGEPTKGRSAQSSLIVRVSKAKIDELKEGKIDIEGFKKAVEVIGLE